jgi:hypothetical protein
MRYKAIYNTHPTVNAVYDEVDAYDKDGNRVELDEALIAAEVARLQAEYDAKQYQRDRAAAYPSIQEQLDMQYWDSINGTTTWQDAISAVKSQYTKN